VHLCLQIYYLEEEGARNMLEVNHLFFQYEEEKVVQDITFSVQKGELVGILGPNGSGKTTLMKLLSGILKTDRGEIVVKGKKIQEYGVKELAKVMAVLPQHVQESFSYTVKEIVSLGRYAHQKGIFQSWSSKDEKILQRVMKQTGISDFQNKSIHELSGGEKQRVYLAQALAQEPEILLLDEPTNHLDLSYQKELLDSLKEWSLEKNLTVICIFHDLNLASLYCDRLLLLHDGKLEIDDIPVEVMEEERIKRIYRTSIKRTFHPTSDAPQINILPNWEQEKGISLDLDCLTITPEQVKVSAPLALKTLPVGVTESGFGWYKDFLIHQRENPSIFADSFSKENGGKPSNSVKLLTMGQLDNIAVRFVKEKGISFLLVVCAEVEKELEMWEATKYKRERDFTLGAIHIWAFINGELSDQAFLQSVMRITEAKTAALAESQIVDKLTGIVAERASADSVLIAATQQGSLVDGMKNSTYHEESLSKSVYDCIKEVLLKVSKESQAN